MEDQSHEIPLIPPLSENEILSSSVYLQTEQETLNIC